MKLIRKKMRELACGEYNATKQQRIDLADPEYENWMSRVETARHNLIVPCEL